MNIRNKLYSFLLAMKYVDFELCFFNHDESCNPWVTGRREWTRPTIWRKSSESQVLCPELIPRDGLLLKVFKVTLKISGILSIMNG